MIKSVFAYHILNTVLIICGLAIILRFIHLFNLFGNFPVWYYTAPIGIVLLLKSQLKPENSDLKDPLTTSIWARRFIYSAMGILMIAIMFKIMHWPLSVALFLFSMVLQLLALVASYLSKSESDFNDDEILDR